MASRRASRSQSRERTVWHRAPKREVGRCVVETVNRQASDQSYRRVLTKRRLGTYLGRTVDSLSADLFHQRRAGAEITQSYAQSVADTAQANIACKQRPKAQALTKGGDYYDQLEAEKLSKFMEGCLWNRQGCYANAWELGEHCFHDSTMFEAGLAYVYGCPHRGKVVYERVFAHDCFVDSLDAHTGSPRGFSHMHVADRWDLIEQFGKKDTLLAAKLHKHHKEYVTGDSADLVTVYKSWRIGPNGRHVIAVDGPGDCVLDDVEYERDHVPFASMFWQRNAFGYWGQPMVDQIASTQAQANLFLEYMLENTKANAQGYAEYKDGDYEEADLASAMPHKLVKRKAGSESSLNVAMPALFNPQLQQFFMMLKSSCYELPGWSEMSTQGRKEQSVTSGVAVRTVNSMQDQRHLARSRGYEQFFVTLGRLSIEAVQDLVAQGIKPTVAIPDNDFLETIDWEEIDFKEDQFQITLQASSATEDTVAARRQTIEDLVRLNYLDPAVGEQMLTAPNPDIESLTKRESAQRRYMDELIAKFSKWRPEKTPRKEVFEPPDPLFDLPQAMIQITDGYIVARSRRAPEPVLQLFRDWLTEAQEAQKRLMAEQAARQQAAAGAQPPMGPGPGAPPGGPPMPPNPGMPMPAPVAQLPLQGAA